MTAPKRIVHLFAAVFLAAAPGTIAQQRKAQPPPALRLYVFDCGNLNISDTSNYQLKKEELATTFMALPSVVV